jgi:CelD/BcsL family acetyltransferase involved in cellulose biosynthesis
MLTADCAGSLRTRLRRARKRLAEAGTASYERIRPGPEQVPALLATIQAVEEASWKGRRGVGIFSTESNRRFFAALAERLASRSQLEIWLMRLDGQVISYRFAFLLENTFYDYNLAFLPEFDRLSPGRVLLDEIVAACARDGLAAVDASRASLRSGHILRDWTDEYVDHHQLWIFNRGIRAHLLRGVRFGLKPIVKRLRKLPHGAPAGAGR